MPSAFTVRTPSANEAVRDGLWLALEGSDSGFGRRAEEPHHYFPNWGGRHDNCRESSCSAERASGAHVYQHPPSPGGGVHAENVNLIDGTGAPAKRNATLIIANDRIRSVSTGQAPVLSGVKVVDMHGLTIMPLIINTHGHLGLVKGASASASNQTDDNFRHQLLRYQEYGVGTVLSMGTDGQKFADIRKASRRGAFPGADVYSAGIGIGGERWDTAPEHGLYDCLAT
jgi:hypothetical protein